MSNATFLWHDYETSGADPARDRPVQFAARRTTLDLEPVGEPLMLYCQPALDVLPHPDAALITGISPQLAQREGVAEHEFARQISEAFGKPHTCGVGYNSIRFDDEVTRHLLYRNFYDPYLREWFGGNSRWDLIDVVRLWHALRPEGLIWPKGENGATSFKLELLSKTNGLAHDKAHDALSDVDATIALARQLKTAQPKLFEHALKLRDKHFAATLLNLSTMAPVVHVSSKIPAARGCIAVVAPLAQHPKNKNEIVVYDLSQDPTDLLALDADEIRERVFSSDADLPEGMTRIPLKGVHLNKSPMLAPLSTLSAEQAARWQIDLAQCQTHRDALFSVRAALAKKIQAVFAAPKFAERDAELSLYGGFLAEADKPRLTKVREAAADELWRLEGVFQDPRYNELLFRYRARNFPDSLNDDERARWREFVQNKLTHDTGLAGLTMEQYQQLVAERLQSEKNAEKRQLLQQLQAWPEASGLLRLVR